MEIVKKAVTDPIVIRTGAFSEMSGWLLSRFQTKAGAVICDKNTLPFAGKLDLQKIVFDGDVTATDRNAHIITEAAKNVSFLVACGAGTVHDLTRYAAHAMSVPFISCPTAASVDGFVSNVAAMTVDGRKVTFPSTAPAALFADDDIYGSAPPVLCASGVGDIVGKYISLFDWKASHIITGEEVDGEIVALEQEAVSRVMETDIGSKNFSRLVMECLVKSGLAIQYWGNSRPASGAEHHLSHLWEMHCINKPTPALHGEKVGVATLLVLEQYKRLASKGITFSLPGDYFSRSRLSPVFGALTDGILEENTPDPFAGITSDRVKDREQDLIRLIGQLPQPDCIRRYLQSCGAKTTLAEIGLPDNGSFRELSLKYAPFVRRRLTLLKLIAANR